MLYEFNKVIDYIENNLTCDVSKEKIEQMVCMSEYHFRRMFSYLTGMSLNEYIRNRRFSLANEELIQGMKVTEVAFKYNYKSVDGFSKAFQEWSGYRPSEVSKNKIQKSFPKLTFYLEIKGGISMNYKIERKEKFNLVGVSKRVPIQFQGENNSIIELAKSITEKQKDEMHKLGDLYPNQVVNASYDFDKERFKEQGALTQIIGFLTTKENPYSDLTQVKVHSHTWAIFPVKGAFPEKLQETWAKIFSEWLPCSNYELVEAPEICFTNFKEDTTDKYSEIWIAVKEK